MKTNLQLAAALRLSSTRILACGLADKSALKRPGRSQPPAPRREAGIFSVALLALLTAAGVSTAPAAALYFAGTGHWYEPVKVPSGVTWFDAYTNAINRGGYLCTITNAAENTFAASLVDITYYSGVSVNNDILGPWLGGFRHAGQGNWQWVSGEPFGYANWYPNQPDGYGASEQRLQFYNRSTTGSTWGDHPGGPIAGYSLPRGFIVEYDQPKLSVARSNNVVAIVWPQPATNWILETTAALSVSSVWTPVPSGQYQTNLADWFITVTNPVGNAFYRLRRD